jgi:purine-binding chemotaxis protein CheW
MSSLAPFGARALSHADVGSVAAPAGTFDVLGVRLGDEDYALPLAQVREILKVPAVTDVPRGPPAVLGILSLRGTVVTLFDLRLRLGLPSRPVDRRTRVLIVSRGDEPVGLLVDAVTEVIRLRQEDVEDHPAIIATAHVDYYAGIARRRDALWVLLDLKALLESL